MVDVEWSHPAGCGVGGSNGGGSGDENKGEEKKERVGSGIGWFFLVWDILFQFYDVMEAYGIMCRLLLAIIAYFALGAYYNYTTYGASGVDLIPYSIPLSGRLS
jgi:autophagy-related protein 27